MKKLIGIGLAIALLTGCGGASTTTNPTAVASDTGAVATIAPNNPGAATAVTGAEATSVTGTDATAVTGTEATSMPSTNATSVTGTDATAVIGTDATSMPSPNLTEQPTQPGSLPSTDATAQPSEPSAGSSSATAIDPATVTQSVSIADLGITFKVPAGWAQASGENSWSASGADMPRVGVTSAKLNTDWLPSSMLPKGATIKSSEVQTIPLGQVNIYTVENSDGTAESHTIVRSAENAYDVFVRTATLKDLRAFQPVSNAIINSIQLNEG